MKSRVKAKVLKKIRSYKITVLDWQEYMDDTQAMKELREMSGKEVVRTIREVWEDIKSID